MDPLLFSVYNLYMDGLSDKLNILEAGCYIGNICLNHIMFADDICCICPSVKGVQKLIKLCEEYAITHDPRWRKHF